MPRSFLVKKAEIRSTDQSQSQRHCIANESMLAKGKPNMFLLCFSSSLGSYVYIINIV